jgi:Concanavalin A-like lectin/glucanases superfamily/PEP-CTERM motif
MPPSAALAPASALIRRSRLWCAQFAEHRVLRHRGRRQSAGQGHVERRLGGGLDQPCVPAVHGRPHLLYHREPTNGDDFDPQLLQTGNADNQLRIYTNSGGFVGSATDFTASSLNQWISVAGTFTANGTADVDVNGVLDGSGSAGGHGDPDGTFYQGQSNVFGDREFDGSLGGVAVFNTQLTGDQIDALYNAAFTAPNGGPLGVPEPSAWALLIAGFGLAGAALRRRRTATAIA